MLIFTRCEWPCWRTALSGPCDGRADTARSRGGGDTVTMLLGLTAPDGAGGAGAMRNVATCFLSSELPSAGESHPNWMCPAPCPLTKCFINPGFGAGGRPWPPRATWTHLSPHLLSAPGSHPSCSAWSWGCSGRASPPPPGLVLPRALGKLLPPRCWGLGVPVPAARSCGHHTAIPVGDHSPWVESGAWIEYSCEVHVY